MIILSKSFLTLISKVEMFWSWLTYYIGGPFSNVFSILDIKIAFINNDV